MADKLTQLYHGTILEHNEKPFHFEKRPSASIILNAYNPLCGDKFKLFLDIENGRIVNATFHGYGCAVSKASTSVLMQKIQGIYMSELPKIIAGFFAVFKNQQPPEDAVNAAFFVAKEFPGRMKCATLSWESLDDFLKTATI